MQATIQRRRLTRALSLGGFAWREARGIFSTLGVAAVTLP